MKKRKNHFTIALCALVAAAMLAPAADAETIRAAIVPITFRRAAPAFTLLDASGKSVRLSDFRGKPVLLNFWATDCGGCVLEIPSFVELDQAYKDKGLTVLGISMDILYENLKNSDEAWSKVRPFVATHQVNYRILMGDNEVSKRYNVQALPITQLVDRSGRVAATYIGIVNKENLSANIQTLLSER